MRVCLFEDSLVADLEPLTLTRPVFALLCGCTSLADKQYRYFADLCPAAPADPDHTGCLVRPALARLAHEPISRVNDSAWLNAAPVMMVNGRWLPPPPSLDVFDGPCVGVIEDEVAFALVWPEHLSVHSSLDESLARWRATLPHRNAGGRLLRHLWELVEHNGEQISLDAWLSAPHLFQRSEGSIALVGPADRLLIHPTAKIDPLVMADTTAGPVIIDHDATVTAFTRLEGPCYVGPHTQVHGAKIRSGTTLGPHCRIGGEVEASIVQGFSNKYHDGFLGHAYVGEWVNLGAGTQNSDLRNDYGEVRMTCNGRQIDTGRTKVGCYLGDHTRTGLSTLLNTGTNAGVFCNLLPTGGLLPRFVPSFSSIWNGALVENTDLPTLLRTADVVMRRRGRSLTEAHEEVYGSVLEQTAAIRRQAIRDAEARRLRRSA